jgi:hypothetical protein
MEYTGYKWGTKKSTQNLVAKFQGRENLGDLDREGRNGEAELIQYEAQQRGL